MSRIRCYIVGRDTSAAIVLQHETVSRRHAELVPVTGGQVYVTDCASTCGTFIDKGGRWEKISQDFVNAGGRVRFGDVEVSVQGLLADIARLPAGEGAGPGGSADPGGSPGVDKKKQVDASRGVVRDPDTGEPIAM